jgi:signal transduction histidine kinase
MAPAVETQQNTLQAVGPLRRAHEELSRSLRALGHDMTANFMLLESSFRRLKVAREDRQYGEFDELASHVEACLRESKRFLDDLRRLAQTGSFQMEPSRVDLGAVVEEVLFEQRELLQNRGVQVDVRSPLADVWCNRQRAKQVVTNLVRNAAIHGCDPHRPKVSISTSWVPAVEKGGSAMVSIRVHDNGPGIDPAVAEEIFLPGRRLSKRSASGSGMGLAIVRDIVGHYGGTVKVDPECKSGTAIEAALPAALVPHPLARPHWELASGADEPARSAGRDNPHSSTPPSHPARCRHPGFRGRL